MPYSFYLMISLNPDIWYLITQGIFNENLRWLNTIN
jgi:hypothetical protein